MKSGPQFVFASIAVSRAVYSMSWFVTAAVFPAMAAEYHYPLQALGYFTSAFLIGTAAFQIPVAVYAARHGPTRPALLGLVVLTVAAAASAASGDFYLQFVLRFLSGIGAALFFAPGLVIAADAMRHRSGLATGLYAGLFYLGGGLATFAFPSIASTYGWRLPFVITAAITLCALVQNFVALRNYPNERKQVTTEGLYRVLRSRSVIAVALGVLGGSSVNYVVTQFLVTYAQVHLGYSAALSGAISSLVFIGAVIGGPVAGWLSDHFKRRRLLIFVPVVGSALSVAFFLIDVPVALLLGTFLSGFMISGVFGNAYGYPAQFGVDRRYLAMGIAIINITGLLYGSLSAPVFAAVVSSAGYSAGWVVLILMSLVTAPLIYAAKEPEKQAQEGRLGPTSRS
jgi:MFS transporter, ACDE family, multidrug resistance protein